jgi:hypothetical protein
MLTNDAVIRKLALALSAVLVLCRPTPAQDLDEIGVTLLRAMTTNLNGAGLRVAQPEAEVSTNPPAFEVNPANVGQPGSLFGYFSSAGSASVYPNSLGTNSGHAEAVGDNFYGLPNGVATNVAHVDNYEGDYFFNSVINAASPTNINDALVNQSFIFPGTTVSVQQEIDSAYDNYAVDYKTLFISGAGNGGPVSPPSTCYNGIGVGVSDGSSSYGPTLDNGRSKPDLIAPGGETSFSTPYVAGAAALLLQAALRGDSGGNTNSAADPRILKALLLNGAVKPAGWTNSASAPLDTLYGAGVLNAFNSYEQLASGQHGYIVSTSVTSGSAHPPTGAAGSVSAMNGWDFNSISSSAGGLFSTAMDGVNHYYFNATNGANHGAWVATITLAWNRPSSGSSQTHAAINNLGLFLYNTANSNLVMVCTSMVDNIQHIFVPHLAPGRYDLQVWKAGGSSIVTDSESYGLAWAFAASTLSLDRSGADANLSWPAYPAGFEVQAAASLSSPVWTTNNLPAPVFVNGTNTVQIPMTNAVQFFRLSEPDF